MLPIELLAMHLYRPPSSVRTCVIFKWLTTSPALSTYWPIAYRCNDDTSMIGCASSNQENWKIRARKKKIKTTIYCISIDSNGQLANKFEIIAEHSRRNIPAAAVNRLRCIWMKYVDPDEHFARWMWTSFLVLCLQNGNGRDSFTIRRMCMWNSIYLMKMHRKHKSDDEQQQQWALSI